MSMLSAQCDELRRLASTLDTRYRYADDTATALREAADTILSLRDRAQDLQAENRKLREQGERLFDKTLELGTENDRLRELVRIAGTYCVNGLCGKDDGCPLYLGKPYCALHDRMRELGVEV